MDGVEQLTGNLRACGDATRLRILAALTIRPLCVCELVALVDVGQPAVSRHLGILAEVGLIEASKDGRWVIYAVRRPAAASWIEELLTTLETQVLDDAAFAARVRAVDRRTISPRRA